MRITANLVLAASAQARLRAAPMFAKWCELPADVATSVSDCASLVTRKIAACGAGNFKAANSVADAVINAIARLDPPPILAERS